MVSVVTFVNFVGLDLRRNELIGASRDFVRVRIGLVNFCWHLITVHDLTCAASLLILLTRSWNRLGLLGGHRLVVCWYWMRSCPVLVVDMVARRWESTRLRIPMVPWVSTMVMWGS